MAGILYIVATPIGNLSDMSFRAIETLKNADLILCEDTRVTKKLLNHYDIDTHTLSYHQHSSIETKLRILNDLNSGKILALVTDAGTPGISDPGNELVEFVVENNPLIQIVPIPGASSLSSALSVCGFRVSHFVFVGFLPKKRLNTIFDQVKTNGYALVFFESPNRIKKTLDRLVDEFGPNRKVYIGRELTKLYEEYFRGELGIIRAQLAQSNPKGEVVVVLEGETE